LRYEPSIRRVPTNTAVASIQQHLADGLAAETLFVRDGSFRTSAAVQRTDGFFAAILERPRS